MFLFSIHESWYEQDRFQQVVFRGKSIGEDTGKTVEYWIPKKGKIGYRILYNMFQMVYTMEKVCVKRKIYM